MICAVHRDRGNNLFVFDCKNSILEQLFFFACSAIREGLDKPKNTAIFSKKIRPTIFSAASSYTQNPYHYVALLRLG